jgi:hypothetical protein
MPDNVVPIVAEAYATGEEIGPVVAKIEQALGDVSRTHALIALLSVVLLIQHPDISAEQMYEGVREISRFTCMWLAGPDSTEETTDKSKMN